MYQFFFALLEAAIASLLLIPCFSLLERFRFQPSGTTVCYALFAIYLSGVYAVAGLPNVLHIRFDPRFNWEPFRYMFSDGKGSLLNVALFVPMGLFLPLLWQAFRNPVKLTFFGFLVSLMIEFLQIFTRRATDVNDLITNTVGSLAGWLLAMLAGAVFPVLRRDNRKSDLWVIFAITAGIMFFLHPILSAFMWMLIRN